MNFRKNLSILPFLVLSTLAFSSCNKQPATKEGYDIEEVSNEGGSAFYEIFVGSFCDSNGDGVGDLNGIKSKLPYLKSLGVSGLWLTPIHPSNTYHHYDVKDYFAVSSDFGTVEDFESLCSEAKTQGIKIIIDMVFNHTARDSVPYKAWRNAVINRDTTNDFYDFYCWSPTAKDGWSKDNSLNVYVESHFDSSMPELNYDNPKVRAYLKLVQDFWLDKGASGFRYDAVKYFYCDQVGNNIYGDTEKNVEVLHELYESVKAKKSDAYTVGECWVNDLDELTAYVSSGMNMFYFPTSDLDGVGSVVKASGYTYFRDSMLQGYNRFKEVNPTMDMAVFVTNHDQDRWGSYRNPKKTAAEQRKLMVSSYLLTPGTPFMYYGEEIEMLGIRNDNDRTDAMRRQAMVWGEDNITCKQPENFVYTPQTSMTVKSAQEDGYSMLNHYRKVLSIRNKYKDMFRLGDYESSTLTDDARAFGFKITYNEEEYQLIHNCSDSESSFSVAGYELIEEINTMKTHASVDNNTLKLAGLSSALLKRSK